MRKPNRYKKGFVFDMFSIILTIFVMAMVCLIMATVLYQIRVAFDSSPLDQAGKDIIDNGQSNYTPMLDGLIAMFMIFLPIVSAVSLYFLDVNSIFFWIIILVTVILIIVAAALGNIWEMTANISVFSVSLAQMPYTAQIMGHYALYGLYVGFMVLAGMFFRLRQGGFSG